MKRIYEKAEEGDGYRILVDRLWPRGVSRANAKVDLWDKEIAPSDALRKWFSHNPRRWKDFQKKYNAELGKKARAFYALYETVHKRKKATLLFGAADKAMNNAIVLKRALMAKRSAKPRALKAGDFAPDFSLFDQSGKRHMLSKYRGKWTVVYFYPKDDTPGCTKEACGIRDAFPDFKKLKAAVLGISVDDSESHIKFIKKYRLPFTLLADTGKQVVGEYGVWGKKKFMGKIYEGTLRTTFLIDPKGKIAKIYRNVNPVGHAEELLGDLKPLNKK